MMTVICVGSSKTGYVSIDSGMRLHLSCDSGTQGSKMKMQNQDALDLAMTEVRCLEVQV